jgi:hypothetical protein
VSTVKGTPSRDFEHTIQLKQFGWKALPEARSNFSAIAWPHLLHRSSVF